MVRKFTPRKGRIYNDYEELRRLNKLVQNKQSRLRTQKGLETVGVETKLIQDFTSRKEFNEYKGQMKKFLKRDANFIVETQQGIKVEYGDILETERVVRRVNRQRQRQWEKIKDLPYKNRGQETGMTVEDRADPRFGMGDIKYATLQPIEFDPNRYIDEQALQRRMRHIQKSYDRPDWLERINELFRENYLKALQDNLGAGSRDLQEHIQNMSVDEFIETFYTENNAHIDFIYDQLGIDTRITELERVWGVNRE